VIIPSGRLAQDWELIMTTVHLRPSVSPSFNTFHLTNCDLPPESRSTAGQSPVRNSGARVDRIHLLMGRNPRPHPNLELNCPTSSITIRRRQNVWK
jgi:hypothetical protein